MPKGKKEVSVTKQNPAPARAKKGAEPQLSRAEEIGILTTKINKAYAGRGAVQSGNEFTNVFMIRRPTGIPTLDIDLGGGFPAGGLSQIIGKDGASKTYLANKCIAKTQETYGKDFACSLCMTELAYDKWFAKKFCKVRIAYTDEEIGMWQQYNQNTGQPPLTPEYVAYLRDQVGIVQQATFATAEELLEVAVQHVESNLYQIVLIDSFGALLTAAESEAEHGIADKQRGGAAMVVTQFMHRLHAALNLPDAHGRPNTTTVIGINQWRDNLKAGLYGNPLNISGGYALRHGKLVDLHLEAGKQLKVEFQKGVWTKVGKEINWEIIKGKAGCHDGPKGTYSFYFGEPEGYPCGADTITDLLVAAVRYEIVEQSGAWFSYGNDRIGQGKENAAIFLFQHPEVAAAIQQAVYVASKVAFITRENF